MLIYISLAALFIAALITCNLIANKFVIVNLGFKEFTLSAGVLPYPITFLITDILSELYGRRSTTWVVFSGFFASLLVLFILFLANSFPAIADSPVGDLEFQTVFQNSGRVIMASMLAYLSAQFIDVRVFHFLKRLTQGKALWFRNNFSTFFSQLVDTILVTTVIFFGVKSISFIANLVLDGWFFKVICAALDTFFIYPIIFTLRRHFGLKPGEEIQWY